MIRSFLSLAIVATFTACSSEPVLVKHPVLVNNTVPTNHGTDLETETTIDTAVDTGSFTEETETSDASLTVDFATAWSASVPYSGTIGDNENFGALLFTSNTGVEVTVITVAVSVYIDIDQDGVYGHSVEDNVVAADFVTNCTLVNVISHQTISGPIEPEANGRLVFTDDFIVTGEHGLGLNVYCELTGEVPQGETFGLAADINHLEQAVIATTDGVSLIPAIFGWTNGTQNQLELEPQVAVLINN